MSHICPAKHCQAVIKKSSVFMCRRHWYMVPEYLRRRIWGEYRDGDRRNLHVSHRIAIFRVAVAQGLYVMQSPGLYYEPSTGVMHVEVCELCREAGIPDTKDNRETMLADLAAIVRKTDPEVAITVRGRLSTG